MKKATTKPCEYCGKPVTKTPAQQSQRKHWTCGRSCSTSLAHQLGRSPHTWSDNPYRGQKETRPCDICGKPVTRYLTPERIEQKWTCSYECAGKQKYSRDNIPGGKKPRRGDYVSCTICEKEFYRQPVYIEQGRHLCSRECNALWQSRNRSENECEYCGKSFVVKPSQKEKKYCSMECYQDGRITRPTGRIHNGRPVRKNSTGYVLIWEPDHPNKSMNGWQLEHRIVSEKKVGRYLESDDHVHHINAIKDDNRPENLVVMNPSDHSKETNADNLGALKGLRKKVAEYERRFGPLEDLDT